MPSLRAQPVTGDLGAASRPTRPGWRRRLPLLGLVLLAAAFLGLGLAEAWSDSPTFDEPVYVAAGLAEVLHHDVAFNDEHPPLPKVLAVLPVLLAHPVIPPNGSWDSNGEQTYGARFVAAQLSAGTLRRVTFASRLVPLAESIGVAFVLFALGTELFGPGAGAFAGALWLASPFVLGIGHLDGVDVPFALAAALSAWALVRWLRTRRTGALVWVGLALGAVADSQISGLLIVASSLAVIVVFQWRSGIRRALASAGLAGLIALAAVWASYLVLTPSVLWHAPAVLPRPYLDGTAYLASQDTIGTAGYVAGIAYTGGRWWFWPVSLVIKWPAASLLLLVAGLVACVRLPRGVRGRLAGGVALPALVLTVFTLMMPRDIGLRYLLPVIALWAVPAGALVPAITAFRPRLRSAARAVVAGLLAVALLATAWSFPRSLAWTTRPFRPAYTAVTDSNVDWGQALYALSAWSASHHPWVLYFGPRGITAAAIPGARPWPGTAPAGISGWAAVSVTALNSSNRSSLGWLRRWCPVGLLDDSILLYHFRQSPAASPEATPAQPPPLCPGTWSSAR
ncbi:MAG: glycosyltransferase family 39 protein [Streptosporangiaceae bacterium]